MAVVSAAAFGAATPARAGTELIVSGHGWGHGVGMSQWGAYGYALHGWNYKRILFHYYPGTRLAAGGDPRVRVLLAPSARLVTIGCAAPLHVSDGRRFTGRLPARTYGVGARLALPVHHRRGVDPFARGFAVFSCPRAPLTLDGRAYHGNLAVRSNGRTLSVVNSLSLDTYLLGVVPSESPSHWPLAELEAQAVAARSYAVSELKPNAPYDLLPDTRDQVYGGVAAERPRSDRAVLRTRGEILTWDGQVARTYYSSSSGGRTESVQDAWPGSAPIPYLRSVSDPYDTYSPLHDWGPFAYSASRLAQRLGIAGAVASVRIERDSSWRVSSVQLRLSSGAVASRSGDQVMHALGLRSTWFSIGSLSLSASREDVLYGQSVRVVARAADVKGAVLEQRSADGQWRTVRQVRRGGTVLSLEPLADTAFRVREPGASGTSIDVAVVPRLHVRVLGPHLLSGKVLPSSAGPIEVWRLERGVWRVVSRPRLLRNGDFSTPLRLRATTYKVTAGGDGELAAALTRVRVTRGMLAAYRP